VSTSKHGQGIDIVHVYIDTLQSSTAVPPGIPSLTQPPCGKTRPKYIPWVYSSALRSSRTSPFESNTGHSVHSVQRSLLVAALTMSLFAKNYSLTASATYHGEEPKSPEIGAFSKRTIGKRQSLSNSSLRNGEVPMSPSALSKAKSLFSKTHHQTHGSLDIELGALSVNHMPSPRRLSSSGEVPTLDYSSGPVQEDPVMKDGYVSFTTSKSPPPVKEAVEYFTRPSRNGSRHITIAVDPSAMSRAKKETQSQRNSGGGYSTYEACMEGARGHEKKSGTYPQGSEKVSSESIVSVARSLTVQGFALQAKHHLNRSSDLFGAAIAFKPDQVEALVGRYASLTLAEK
jgi:hypothetical protein